MTMTVPTRRLDGPDEEATVALLRCLGDATRLRILRHLTLGEHRVSDLVAHLGLAQSTVSAHVASLRDCGLLADRVAGRSVYYRLLHAEHLNRLLATAEDLLALSGHAGSAHR